MQDRGDQIVKPWKSMVVRDLFREYLPAIHQAHREVNREGSVASTWLVSLTTGFLAFLLARPQIAAGATDLERRVLLVMATLVVASGVVYRFIHLAMDRAVAVAQKEIAFLLAVDGSETLDPSEPELLDDLEDVARAYQEIVGRRIPERYLKAGYPEARKYYASLFPRYIEREQKAVADLERKVGAVLGFTAQDAVGLFGQRHELLPPGVDAPLPAEATKDAPPVDEGADSVRAAAKTLARQATWGVAVFYVQLLSFFGMIAAVVWILW